MATQSLGDYQRRCIVNVGPHANYRGMDTLTLSGVSIAASTNMGRVSLYENGGGQCGWLLGSPIDLETGFIRSALHLPFSLDDPTGISSFEELLGCLAGSYLVILIGRNIRRVYLDAIGSIPVVFDSKNRMAASSIHLLDTSNSEIRADLSATLDILHKDSFFPFGLTPFHGISRLLPNHYLDLDTWETCRHWAPPSPEHTPAQDLQIIEQINSRLRRVIEIVTSDGSSWMSLTAGYDSRALLSCSLGNLENIVFFTWSLPDSTARADIQVARKIARRMALRHTVFPYYPARTTDREDWLHLTGGCVGETRGRDISSMILDMPKRQYFIAGHASEVGRCFYWKPDDTQKLRLDPDALLTRMWLPKHQTLREAAETWISQAPDIDGLSLLDLVYIEQRLGCWLGPLYDIEPVGRVRITPFAQRAVFELMMQLTPSFKRAQWMVKELISANHPDLLKFPVNPVPIIDKLSGTMRNGLRKMVSRTPLIWRMLGRKGN